MPWTYHQTSGHLTHNGKFIEKGYSGRAGGRNKPDAENQADTGPIPRGKWKVGRPRSSPRTGPHVLDLTPIRHNAHGRRFFQIHGDNSTNNASRGCIIMSRKTRELISRSGDDVLEVVR